MGGQYYADKQPTKVIINYKAGQFHFASEDDPGRYVSSSPRRRDQHIKGDNHTSVRADDNLTVGGNRDSSVSGTDHSRSGTKSTIVGSPGQFQTNPADTANRAATKLRADMSSTPKEKPKMSLVAALAKVPQNITNVYSKCVPEIDTKVHYQPTGNFLEDVSSLGVYMMERLSELSVASIVDRALLVVRDEANRIALQFSEASVLNISWFSEGVGSLFGEKKAANPSSQNQQSNYTLTTTELGKHVAAVHEQVMAAEREGA